MTKYRRIAVIIGTRPEGIKMAPVILKLKEDESLTVSVCTTGQHKEMLDQVLEVFNIVPDCNLELMSNNQSISKLAGDVLIGIDGYLDEFKPDVVLVQGDTTTVMAASIAAYYRQIKIGHIEAGLRTGNLYSPWPEEGNRVIAGHLADFHFCPTETSKKNLLDEGIASDKIFITGNTVIDALFWVREKLSKQTIDIKGLPLDLLSRNPQSDIVLITGHRRESFGEGFENICKAIAELAYKFPHIDFVYPVHLNPNVREPVNRILRDNLKKNIHLIEPLEYQQFISLMDISKIILTDSGGIQEEAPSLGKPVLVMRDTTERPEAVETGNVRLIGTDFDKIIENTSELILNVDVYKKMSEAVNPYGDGKAAERIMRILT